MQFFALEIQENSPCSKFNPHHGVVAGGTISACDHTYAQEKFAKIAELGLNVSISSWRKSNSCHNWPLVVESELAIACHK